MSVNVELGRTFYPGAMTVVLRLLTLIALVLMPLGMAATTAHDQSASHADATDHCSGAKEPDKAPATQPADCAMNCTALPATEQLNGRTVAMLNMPRLIGPVVPFRGIVPEIATPPPRLS